MADRRAGSPTIDALGEDACDYQLIELLFFAYRDFVGDPDRVLARFGFGRAHHRVLHFVDRNPGLTIAELLEILKITKQSLNRVLKELLDSGEILQRPGRVDRRQRLLYTTERGHALARSLALAQSRRIAQALAEADPAARQIVARFLIAMVDNAARETVRNLVNKTSSERPER